MFSLRGFELDSAGVCQIRAIASIAERLPPPAGALSGLRALTTGHEATALKSGRWNGAKSSMALRLFQSPKTAAILP
eukprot:scaffold1378_cov257-Pinguiococcus_pyrenoidosus.AAC.8